MAPKGKKGKKQQDDWEAELGEDASTQQNGDVVEQENPEPVAGADEEVGGGGLLATLKKNKDKRKKKGKQDNDFVEGEDLAAIVNGDAPSQVEAEIANKAPEEATLDDVDAFAESNDKKGKGGRKEPAKPLDEDDDDNDSNVGGGVKSKKEKEKEKKEREKARKREQVSKLAAVLPPILTYYTGYEKERCYSSASASREEA